MAHYIILIYSLVIYILYILPSGMVYVERVFTELSEEQNKWFRVNINSNFWESFELCKTNIVTQNLCLETMCDLLEMIYGIFTNFISLCFSITTCTNLNSYYLYASLEKLGIYMLYPVYQQKCWCSSSMLNK